MRYYSQKTLIIKNNILVDKMHNENVFPEMVNLGG